MTTNRVTEEPGEAKVSRPVLQGGGGWQRPSPTQPYGVCTALSIPCPNSPTYLALYKVSRATLAANLTAIRAGVAALMDELAPALNAAPAA